MIFYEDLALLHTTANKRTMFFAELISRMDADNVVNVNANIKREICKSINSKTNNPVDIASTYIKQLCRNGMLRSLGGGGYLVNPKIAGFSNYADTINKKMERWINVRYTKDGSREITVGHQKTNK